MRLLGSVHFKIGPLTVGFHEVVKMRAAFIGLVALWGAGTALATNVPVPIPQLCAKVNAVVEILRLAKATPFCAEFLHVKTVTSTATAATRTATKTKLV